MITETAYDHVSCPTSMTIQFLCVTLAPPKSSQSRKIVAMDDTMGELLSMSCSFIGDAMTQEKENVHKYQAYPCIKNDKIFYEFEVLWSPTTNEVNFE